EIDRARLLQRAERGDCRHQLHSVVGGLRFAAGEFLGDTVEAQDRSPAARTGIARTGTVGEDLDVLHGVTAPYSEAEPTCRWKRILRTYSSGSRLLTNAPSGPFSQS